MPLFPLSFLSAMNNRTLLIAASIIGGSLLILSYALLRLTVELAVTRQESGDLVQRIETLSGDVPRIAEIAGDQAGRSAVRGAVDQAVVQPFRQLAELAGNPNRIAQADTTAAPDTGYSNSAPANTRSQNSGDTTISIPPLPNIYIEFDQPQVYIEIAPQLDASTNTPK